MNRNDFKFISNTIHKIYEFHSNITLYRNEIEGYIALCIINFFAERNSPLTTNRKHRAIYHICMISSKCDHYTSLHGQLYLQGTERSCFIL